MTDQLLAPLHPNQTALTPLFQANVKEDMLREIAEADYGESADECYALLQPIWRTGLVESDHYILLEVLQLISFSEPEVSDWNPGGQGPRGHWMRLFACTALVQRDPWYQERPYGVWNAGTLARLVSSAIALGEPVERAAASLLAWRFLTNPGDEDERPFLAFAVLLLAVHLGGREDRGTWLKHLAGWVEEEESRARKENPARSGWFKPEWLLGLTGHPENEGRWRALAHSILASPESPHPREADEALRRFCLLIPKSWKIRLD
jgi:hypothetical protein